MCTFLKSRCDSVRETASDTLIRMMTTLGPVHLSAMLSATEPILQRGFQDDFYQDFSQDVLFLFITFAVYICHIM